MKNPEASKNPIKAALKTKSPTKTLRPDRNKFGYILNRCLKSFCAKQYKQQAL